MAQECLVENRTSQEQSMFNSRRYYKEIKENFDNLAVKGILFASSPGQIPQTLMVRFSETKNTIGII